MASNSNHQDAQAPGLVQSAKEVLGGEERREDKDELTSQDFSNAATGVQASSVAGALKEKIVPTAQATGPKEEQGSVGQELGGAAREAKDKVVGGAQYVADRFTAPAGGDESQQAKDKGKEAADKSKEAADKAAGKSKEAADDAGQSFSAAARDVKDSIASGAGYVADRFTANPSGQGQGSHPDTKEAKEKTGGFLSNLLPKSNEGDAGKPGEGKSVGDKARDKYDNLKDEANKTQDTIADKITPTTQEEADLSAGYLPSSTAQEK